MIKSHSDIALTEVVLNRRKLMAIVIAAFMLAACFLFSGCNLWNNDVAPEPEAIVPEVAEPEPETLLPPEPELTIQEIWEQRLATKPLAFGFANEEGSKLILVDYNAQAKLDAEAEVDSETAIVPAPDPAIDPEYNYEEDDAPFGFMTDTGFDTDMFSLAIGAYSEIWPIYFSKWQNETRANNYRDTYDNFDNLPGFLYAQKDWKLKKNQTYL